MAYTITGEKKLVYLKNWLSRFPRDSSVMIGGGNKYDLAFLQSMGFQNTVVSNNSEKELEGCEGKFFIIDLVADLPKKYCHAYDIVIAMDVIEHLVNPDYALVNFNKMLKDGGTVIITTPNLATLSNRLFLLLGWSLSNYHPGFIKTGNPIQKAKISTNFRNSYAHKSVFTTNQLKELLELYGFQIEKVAGYHYGSTKGNASGGNYGRIRDFIDTISPISLKEGIFIAARKEREITISELVARYTLPA